MADIRFLISRPISYQWARVPICLDRSIIHFFVNILSTITQETKLDNIRSLVLK